jgi:hypothetical protein
LAVLYTVATCLLATVIVGVWQAFSHGHFFDYTVSTYANDPFERSKLMPLAIMLLGQTPVLVIAGLWQARQDAVKTRMCDPAIWALAWVGLISAGGFVKIGGWLNSMMPLHFLLGVPAGVFLGRKMVLYKARLPGFAAMCAVLAQLLLVLVWFWTPPEARREIRLHAERVGQLIEAELTDPNLRIFMYDRVSFAVRQGYPVYDIVGLGRPAIDERLRSRIAAQYFDKILLPQVRLDDAPQDLGDLLRSKYRVERVLEPDPNLPGFMPMVLLVPQKRTSSQAVRQAHLARSP